MNEELSGRAAAGTEIADGGRPAESGKRLLSGGSVLGGLASVSCCLVPLVLLSLGAGGSLISTMTALAPYQPIFIAATLIMLGGGFYLVYRKPKPAARAADGLCASPRSDRRTKAALWLASAMVAAAVVFNLVMPVLLDV